MDPQREPEQRRVPVHQRSHRCLSYSNVAATLALVIAIGGGSAWAAQHVHYLVTSSNQIKPSVLKKLHGAKGTTGAKGTIGARGVAGTAAVNGAAGVSGGNGANGAAGVAGPTGLGGPTGGSGAIGATGVTGPNGAVAGYSAAAADITFTGGTDTLIVSKDLPAGDFILSGAATITAVSANASTPFAVQCTLSDTASTASDTSQFQGLTSFPVLAFYHNAFSLPFVVAVHTTGPSTAEVTCTDAFNGGNSYAVLVSNATITVVQTAVNS